MRYFVIKHETSENQSDTICWSTLSGQAGIGCFRFRLQGIRASNKPVIRLKAIRERKNSLRSDNILSRINAAPRALTISNPLPQSPSASYPRPSRKVHQRGCIRLIFCIHPIGSISPAITELDKPRRKGNCIEKDAVLGTAVFNKWWTVSGYGDFWFCLSVLYLPDIWDLSW